MDLLRAMSRMPDSLSALIDELKTGLGKHELYDGFVSDLIEELGSLGDADATEVEGNARAIVGRLALALEGCVLLSGENSAVAEAFCQGRFGSSTGFLYGNLPAGLDFKALIERATPNVETI